MMIKPMHHQRGATLLEYCLVLGITGILYTLSIAHFSSPISRHQAHTSLTQLLDTIEYGRSIAMNEREPVYLRSTTQDQTFNQYELVRQMDPNTSTLLKSQVIPKTGKVVFNHGKQLKISSDGKTMTAGRFDMISTKGERIASLIVSRSGRCRIETG